MPRNVPIGMTPYEMQLVADACAKSREGGQLDRREDAALERVTAKIDNAMRAIKARENEGTSWDR